MSVNKIVVLTSLFFLIARFSIISFLGRSSSVSNTTSSSSGNKSDDKCNYGISANYAIAITNEDVEDQWDPVQPCSLIDMELATVSLVLHNLEDIIDNSSICSFFRKESDYNNITISELTIWIHIQRHSSVIHDPHLNNWISNVTTKYTGSSVCLFDDFGNYWCEDSESERRSAILCQKLPSDAILAARKYWKRFWAVTAGVIVGFTILMLLTYLVYQKCAHRSTRNIYNESILFSR